MQSRVEIKHYSATKTRPLLASLPLTIHPSTQKQITKLISPAYKGEVQEKMHALLC
jgi:hypothetical protein